MPLTINAHTDNILRDITLHLDQDENLLILGPNGAGKTTLAKTLAGLRSCPTLRIDGVEPATAFGHTRTQRVNYVPTKLQVFDDYLSVYDFLSLGHFNTALSIEEALQMCTISSLQNRRCTTLSSGEGQLVLFASALLHGASYTIFDEPTANLDPIHIRLIYHLLRESSHLHSRILITHRLDIAYKLGWRICYMQDGGIVFNDNNAAFFSPKTLQHFFDDTVGIVDHHAVVLL